MRLEPTEYEIQKAYFQWVRQKAISDVVYCMICSSQNGAYLGSGACSYNKLLAAGFSKGFPDVMCLVPASGWHGLFIEFKSANGKQSPEQKQWEARLVKFGYCYRLMADLDEAMKVTTEYLKHIQVRGIPC